MVTTYCPAAHEMRSGAAWRCNLLPGHAGFHDDGMGDQWCDDTATPGPDRLQVAAVNLLGSYPAWEALRPALEKAVGPDLVEDAITAVHDVLYGWVRGSG